MPGREYQPEEPVYLNLSMVGVRDNLTLALTFGEALLILEKAQNHESLRLPLENGDYLYVCGEAVAVGNISPRPVYNERHIGLDTGMDANTGRYNWIPSHPYPGNSIPYNSPPPTARRRLTAESTDNTIDRVSSTERLNEIFTTGNDVSLLSSEQSELAS